MQRAVKNKRWLAVLIAILLFIFFVTLKAASTGTPVLAPAQLIAVGAVIVISISTLYASEAIRRAGEQWISAGFEPDSFSTPTPATLEAVTGITVQLPKEDVADYLNARNLATLEALLEDALVDFDNTERKDYEGLCAILFRLAVRYERYEVYKERVE